MDTIAAEALAKFVGFQPKSVSEVQEATSFALRSNAFYAQNSSEIRAQWAKALYEKGDAAVQRVRDRLESWKAGKLEHAEPRPTHRGAYARRVEAGARNGQRQVPAHCRHRPQSLARQDQRGFSAGEGVSQLQVQFGPFLWQTVPLGPVI